ncbi:MAG: hypothetical protein NTV40_03460 [Solirubrobacterales bacterium]|nr:hypothetical protein [Solirubrobacterales bacterium]
MPDIVHSIRSAWKPLVVIPSLALLLAAIASAAYGQSYFSVSKATNTMSSPTSRTLTTKVTVPSSGTIMQKGGTKTKCSATKSVAKGSTYTMKCRISNDPMPMPALVLTLRTIFEHRTDTPFTSSQTVRLSRCVYGVAGSHPTAHAAC